MSTFVVTFVGASTHGFQGRVEHISTGEGARFASVTDLLLFFEEMNGVTDLGGEAPETLPEGGVDP